jgi:hypothetical protein
MAVDRKSLDAMILQRLRENFERARREYAAAPEMEKGAARLQFDPAALALNDALRWRIVKEGGCPLAK